MDTRLIDAIDNVKNAAQADTTGTGQDHVKLLHSIHKLRLAAEKPAEKLTRMRFEVCFAFPSGLDESTRQFLR